MKKTLEQLADVDTDDTFKLELPIAVTLNLTDHPSPGVAKNLAKLRELGICTGDAVFAMLANAPLDPINLMGTLMKIQPEGWRFSAIDFSMVRVLSQTPEGAVAAAFSVDLLGTGIVALALNKKKHLTLYKHLEVDARPTMLQEIQALAEETAEAWKREWGDES